MWVHGKRVTQAATSSLYVDFGVRATFKACGDRSRASVGTRSGAPRRGRIARQGCAIVPTTLLSARCLRLALEPRLSVGA